MEAIDKVGAESIKAMAGEIVMMQNIIEGKTTRCEKLERQLAEVKAELATYKSANDALVEQPDTQEKIDADKREAYSIYWNCVGGYCDLCPSLINGLKPREYYGVRDCFPAQYMDIQRRQMEFDAKCFDWDGFRAEKFVVNCRTKEAAKDFCSNSDKQGMRWYGSACDSTNYDVFNEETCYTGKGRYESVGFYRNKGKRVVEWHIGMGDRK